MRVRTKPLKKSITGGKARKTAQPFSRFAQRYMPEESDSARSFIQDMCLGNIDKTIDLEPFEQLSTVPGHTDYTGFIAIANREVQTYL